MFRSWRGTAGDTQDHDQECRWDQHYCLCMWSHSLKKNCSLHALQVSMCTYIIWRALRSLTPGWGYAYALPFWLCEFAGFVMSNAFVASLWNQIARPTLRLEQMLPLKERPHVDVYIVTYSGKKTPLRPSPLSCKAALVYCRQLAEIITLHTRL